MAKKLQQLFPPSSEKVELKNLYLYKHGWYASNTTQPRVAANFLSSLDGRIAVSAKAQTKPELPKNLTSDEDFRLFLELHAQADCLITHGGYMRALADNRLGNILQLPNNKECEDLANWRALQGLNPHPTLVIASSSLEFPMHASIKENGQEIYIATDGQADKSKIHQWEDQGYKVIVAGKDKVEGKPLIDALSKEDLKHFYLIAGPKMLHTMIKDQQLSNLYLSHAQQLLGGEFINTMLDGEILNTPKLELKSLFYDCSSENGHGQFFCNYDCQYD
ncbi:MAG: dihydrofolate reductase family protein [Pseudomonadota bacterium]